jgi:DNA polymerase family B
MQSTVQLEHPVQKYNGMSSFYLFDISLPIAETTIVAGARYLMMAKDLVQQRYSDVVNVVYGDTDSVFLKTISNLSVAEAIQYISSCVLLTADLVKRYRGKLVRNFPTQFFWNSRRFYFHRCSSIERYPSPWFSGVILALCRIVMDLAHTISRGNRCKRY